MEINNKRHKQFADEYLANGMNGTRAYLSAYKSVTEDTARANATKLLANAHIKSYIAEQQALSSASLKVTREDVAKEYLELIKSAKDEGIDGQGTIKDRANWARALAQLSKLLGLDSPEQKNVNISGNLNIKDMFGFDDDDE